ncbi:DNA-dependent RNA polymerase subunit epsilon [Rummeliibacillus suwonensis]|jgi:DNA-dependent RNA polymerase auxiliary subunit epsilon|uniref:DNA-dependent RNA polymerase subunit epsilon n=1 Tax=Rummeliibacillus suwonensis TaxID=1306154 RepID=UPI0011B735D4|nr:DNA-directed RNA polymerase subunit epsilon [Rummeliibacillus suwonensis]MBO2534415.1 DNA-dependent RNA polymerase auxiliary subunit epsilon family protein [Rummeliibacillus suwonensis]
MIYKVYYQENVLEVPVRENTKSLYLEAEDVRDAREKLQNSGHNIEYIQLLEGNYLEYEQASEHYKLENL